MSDRLPQTAVRGTAVRAAGADTMLEELVAWLDRRFAPAGMTITAHTPLFEDGLINSIRVLELIAWTERAIGREVADVDIRMDNFRTAARIVAVFGPDSSSGASGGER